ncbi:trypsin-like peptidase domain-containing protein [Photobacterium atrarenae]|uniref:Trypsin-like peptidase domain-containing protein n=1 Tax=Photobacterium atrarenae TaxID=865757 RepID=A0ABY5GLN8_9GAMM|nr:trypsin-like peptidase domain-containing protein [Photobacterium atrarenae]UTV29696.1 trypsin-like peptidase domain-containing protein [Photobacterium atrarenae]
MSNNYLKAALITTICFSGFAQAAVTANDLYNQYKNKPDNKAYAIGTNGVAGSSWGASTKEEAMTLALDTCKKTGGKNCNVTEVNGLSFIKNEPQVKNYSTVNNYNIVSNGVTYIPDLDFSATAFFVNNRHLITTSDVVENCTKISFERDGKIHETTVIRADKMNNISIIKSSIKNDSYATLSSKMRTLQGERTYTYGYDLSDMVNSNIPSYQGKITDGIISRASGRFNDVRFMYITNEINRGNVGGPVISESGDVIGLVSRTNQESIKASILSIFLSEQKIPYHVNNSTKQVSISSIAEKSRNFSVPLVCLNKA